MKKKYTESVSLLQSGDLEKAMVLSSQAGWNQTKADWSRLLALNPDSCYVYRYDGMIVGTATLASYGRELAWIGMILVDVEFQGKGIGRRLLETVICEGRAKGFGILGLDATDQGRRLYRHYGFLDVQPIDRWAGRLSVAGPADQVHPLEEHYLTAAISLDRQWNEYDRGRLIRRLFLEKKVQGLGLSNEGNLRGFLFLRAGRQSWHLGPLLAARKEDFAELLDAAAVNLQGKSVVVDAIRREDTSALLAKRGLKVKRRLTRMTLGRVRQVFSNPELRAAMAFEWG